MKEYEELRATLIRLSDKLDTLLQLVHQGKADRLDYMEMDVLNKRITKVYQQMKQCM